MCPCIYVLTCIYVCVHIDTVAQRNIKIHLREVTKLPLALGLLGGDAKGFSKHCTITLISHASKVMLKILQASLQQYMERELPDVQTGFRKGRGTRDQIANICWIIEKSKRIPKIIYLCFIDYTKVFDCLDHNKL